MIVNGLVAKSCLMLAVQANGAQVVTIEGVAKEDALHPVQEGFRNNYGLQCGYCTPGMVMAANGLLAENPEPSPAEIRHAIEGNLCRCTGYQTIVAAVEDAATELARLPKAEWQLPAGKSPR